jgi:hypothetical protein
MKKPAKKASIGQQQMIVFMDGAGNYYEVPRATLLSCQVSESRIEKVVKALEDTPTIFRYIPATAIPGSTAGEFVGGRGLRYVGFYMSPIKSKR